MGIKSVYVCDNCGKEQIFKTEPIKIGGEPSTFIHTHNPDYSGDTSLIGAQHFCNETCLQFYITNKEREKETE